MAGCFMRIQIYSSDMIWPEITKNCAALGYRILPSWFFLCWVFYIFWVSFKPFSNVWQYSQCCQCWNIVQNFKSVVSSPMRPTSILFFSCHAKKMVCTSLGYYSSIRQAWTNSFVNRQSCESVTFCGRMQFSWINDATLETNLWNIIVSTYLILVKQSAVHNTIRSKKPIQTQQT